MKLLTGPDTRLATTVLCLPIGADRRRPVVEDVPPLDLVAEVVP